MQPVCTYCGAPINDGDHAIVHGGCKDCYHRECYDKAKQPWGPVEKMTMIDLTPDAPAVVVRVGE